MGWWKIRDIESGRIDPRGHEIKEMADVNSALYNGDGPADVMGPAIRKIADMYRESWGRGPKIEELHACLNFCANPWVNEGVFEPWNEPKEKLRRKPDDEDA